ncbi:hypothetical protein ABIA39_008490 [Nocardia sp. GAS34]
MDHVPAYIVGHHTNLLAWNNAATALFATDFAAIPDERRTWAHVLFVDRTSGTLAADQPDMARQVVAYLRLRASHRPDDTALSRLVAEMRSSSSYFAELWDDHDVIDLTHGRYHLHHPEAGALIVDYEFIRLSADPGVRALVTYTTEPGSESRRKLEKLIEASKLTGDR